MTILHSSNAIVIAAFYIALLLIYQSAPKLNIESSKIFQRLIASSGLMIVCSFCLNFFISSPEASPFKITLCIRVYMVLLLYIIVSLIVYLCEKIYVDHVISKLENFLFGLPTLFGWVYIIWEPAKLSYYNGNYYFDGASIRAVFYITFFYLFLFIFLAIKSRKYYSYISRNIFILASILCFLTLVLQYFHGIYPYIDCAISVLLLYLNFWALEYSAEVFDADTGLFNEKGFKIVGNNYLLKKKSFYIINVYLEGLDFVRETFGGDAAKKLIGEIRVEISKVTTAPVFLYDTEDLILIVISAKNKDLLLKLESMPATLLGHSWKINNTNVMIRAKITVIDSSFVKSQDELDDLLRYIIDGTGKKYLTESINIVDEEFVEKEKREKDIVLILKSALLNDGFVMFYQPILNSKTGIFDKAEALIRLKTDPEFGFISPEEFIPIAEQAGLINEIGDTVFKTVCRFIKDNQIFEHGVERMEVNLSPLQAVSAELPTSFLAICSEYDIDPSKINLEITETAASNADDGITDNINAMRKMGFSFSMDDFGTGYSNLARICSEGFDIIKIDKSIVWACFEKNDRESKIILTYTVKMLQALDFVIIAEGIETKEQQDFLNGIGIYFLQGYYFSKPVPEEEYYRFICDKNTKREDIT